jgi:hypothetical protein
MRGHGPRPDSSPLAGAGYSSNGARQRSVATVFPPPHPTQGAPSITGISPSPLSQLALLDPKMCAPGLRVTSLSRLPAGTTSHAPSDST